ALGLVHRDLKPENMLIEPDGRLRITDFGLALALRGDGRFGGATSRSGTPQFAAPEQLLGERVDQRADLYSLAATAYFALLGRPPRPRCEGRRAGGRGGWAGGRPGGGRWRGGCAARGRGVRRRGPRGRRRCGRRGGGEAGGCGCPGPASKEIRTGVERSRRSN